MSDITRERVIVIGAGIAGCIASSVLKAYTPLVIDAREEPGSLTVHDAVMRLRDSKVAEVIGAEYTPELVHKDIYMDGRLKGRSDIRANNLYSRKVYGALGRRSLNGVGDVKRFIINRYPKPPKVFWGWKLLKLNQGKILLQRTVEDEKMVDIEEMEVEYDWLISTIPMPDMMNIAAQDIMDPDIRKEYKFSYSPIYVMRLHLNLPSSVHQTVYFPEEDSPIYRITIQNKDVIIESMESDCDDFWEYLEWAFGISEKEIAHEILKWKKINIGKIHPIDEDLRLRYIMLLTDQHRVLSFGRFSVWKPLRTDQLLSDIEKIRRLISASEIKGLYRSRL